MAWKDPEAGFTLLEVVCVLAIIGLLVALVLPAIPRGTSQARLAGYAVEIAALLKSDRNAAIRSHAQVATALDPGRRIVVSGATASVVEIPADVTFERCLRSAVRQTCRRDDRFLSERRIVRGRYRYLPARRRISDRVNWLTGGVEVVPTGKS